MMTLTRRICGDSGRGLLPVTLLSLGLLLSALVQPSHAQPAPPASATPAPVRVGDIELRQAWSRATPKGAAVGVGYLTIVNHGATPDRLVSGTTTVASKLEIHTMTMDNNVMVMRPLADGIVIPPGGTVTLAPGGLHLMLVGIQAPLQAGQTVPVTLAFERAGVVEVGLAVGGLGAGAPPAADGHASH